MSAPETPPSPLEGARAEAARRLAERAADLAVPLTELRDLGERLRLIDVGLAARQATPTPRRRWPPAFWPALAVGTLVSLAACVPVRTVPFALELRAQSATLLFDTPGELGAQTIDGELRIEGQTRLESPAPAISRDAAAAGSDAIVLRASQLTLRRLAYPAGTTMVVNAGRHLQLGVDAPTSPLVAEVEFAGRTVWRIGDGDASPPADLAHAEWLRASAGDPARPERGPPPLDLWLGRADGRSFAWTGLRPVELRFVARREGEAAGGAPIVASSIEQAQLKLPATNAEVNLGAGDRLEMSGLSLERFEMTAGDSIVLKLAGTARVLATRTGDFERSLKPSLLEFLARHHTVSLLWSSALMLWGAIAWLRNQFDATTR
jgi:hypothetical protein